MKVPTFLKKFWEGIKSLFDKLDETKKKAIEISVKAVEVLKNVLNHPGVDLITKAIPGDKDDKIVAAARAFLPQILVWLKLADEYQLPSPNDLLATAQQALFELGEQDKDAANALKREIAALLVRKITNSEISFSDTAVYVENYYKKEIKGIE